MGFGFGGISGAMFSIVPVIVVFGFVVVIGLMVLRGVQGVQRWSKNNASPRLEAEARVAGKRMDVSQRHQQHPGTMAGMDAVYSTTTYYVTFEVASGDRMELRVQDADYGMISEGDYGKLTFQGTRFLGFQRL